MNLNFGFSPCGLIIFALPMFINLLYVLLPPKEPQPDQKQPIWDEIEQTCRMLFAVAICTIVPSAARDFRSVLFYAMVLFLVLYYIVWIRYFIGGRKTNLLGSKFLFVPMPLAIFPVFYYLCGALWMKNYIAAVLMVLFGVAHNVVSYRNLYGKSCDV